MAAGQLRRSSQGGLRGARGFSFAHACPTRALGLRRRRALRRFRRSTATCSARHSTNSAVAWSARVAAVAAAAGITSAARRRQREQGAGRAAHSDTLAAALAPALAPCIHPAAWRAAQAHRLLLSLCRRPPFDNRLDQPMRTINRGPQESVGGQSFRPGGRAAAPREPRCAPLLLSWWCGACLDLHNRLSRCIVVRVWRCTLSATTLENYATSGCPGD